jgi:hypothetical protein
MNPTETAAAGSSAKSNSGLSMSTSRTGLAITVIGALGLWTLLAAAATSPVRWLDLRDCFFWPIWPMF